MFNKCVTLNNKYKYKFVTHVHMFVGYLATNTFVTHCIYQSDTAIERYRKNQEDGIPRL